LGARDGRVALAESYAAAGHRAEARALLDQLVDEDTRSRRGAFGNALVWAALGETTRALECLERAYEEHDVNMVFLNAFPEFDRLRASARFQQLTRRVGIPS
jgi:Tfp pilus assembly protein PilF